MLLEKIAFLLPFAIFALIVVLVVAILSQVIPHKPKQSGSNAAPRKDYSPLLSWIFLICLALILIFAAIKLKTHYPLTVLGLGAYLLSEQQSAEPERQKQQRVPVYPPKRNDWNPPKVKQQRVPVSPTKRNDWNPPRNSSSPPTTPPKPVPLNRLKLSDYRKQAPKQKPKYHPKQSELLNLLNGDRATAQRLLNQCKKNNPGSSDDWIFEKVIFDIVRDRR